MIENLTISVSFTGDELYETIKLYDILRDIDFELSETQVEVFEKLQDAEVNGSFVDKDDLFIDINNTGGKY